MVEVNEVITIEHKDVPSAIGTTSSIGIFNEGNKYISTGTITSPPPMPKRPDRKPTKMPRKTHDTINILSISLCDKGG